MDPSTDTDFVKKLDATVADLVETNSVEHSSIMETLKRYDRRFDQAERAIEALERGNALLKQILLGSADGTVIGCREIQRDHAKFLKGIRRGAWVVATATTGAAIAWIVAVFNHLSAA